MNWLREWLQAPYVARLEALSLQMDALTAKVDEVLRLASAIRVEIKPVTLITAVVPREVNAGSLLSRRASMRDTQEEQNVQ